MPWKVATGSHYYVFLPAFLCRIYIYGALPSLSLITYLNINKTKGIIATAPNQSRLPLKTMFLSDSSPCHIKASGIHSVVL